MTEVGSGAGGPLLGETGVSILRRLHAQNTQGMTRWENFCKFADLPDGVDPRVSWEASTEARLRDKENAPRALAFSVVDSQEVIEHLHNSRVATATAIKYVRQEVAGLDEELHGVIFDHARIYRAFRGERFIVLSTQDPDLRRQRWGALNALARVACYQHVEWSDRPAGLTVMYVSRRVSYDDCGAVLARVQGILPLVFNLSVSRIGPKIAPSAPRRR